MKKIKRVKRIKEDEVEPWKLTSEFRSDPELRNTLLYRHLELEEASAKLRVVLQSGSTSSSSDGGPPAMLTHHVCTKLPRISTWPTESACSPRKLSAARMLRR